MPGISKSDAMRIEAAVSHARMRGYMLIVDGVPNIAPLTHAAFAAPVIANQATIGRFLTYSTTAAEAAEAGLAMLIDILDNGQPWPEQT